MSPASRTEILELLVSPAHRYDGRPEPLTATTDERVPAITLRAGHGVVGDRYFNQPAHRRASVTLQAVEDLEAMATELGVPVPDLRQTRRTILTRGVALTELLGHDVELDTGSGPVRLRIHRPAPPCAWMDHVIAPGAHRALRRRGGVRAEPLDDGELAVGPLRVRDLGAFAA